VLDNKCLILITFDLTPYYLAPVAERDFFESVSQIPKRVGFVKILGIEYIHRTSSSMTHNHKSQHGTRVQQRSHNYNCEKCDTARCIQSQQASSVLAVEIWLTRHAVPSPASLHYIVSFLIATEQTDGERNEVANMGRLELVNDAFYLIGSAVFQCMKYH
jgi:hypothetical protein